jgi:hypothetical protein
MQRLRTLLRVIDAPQVHGGGDFADSLQTHHG